MLRTHPLFLGLAATLVCASTHANGPDSSGPNIAPAVGNFVLLSDGDVRVAPRAAVGQGDIGAQSAVTVGRRAQVTQGGILAPRVRLLRYSTVETVQTNDLQSHQASHGEVVPLTVAIPELPVAEDATPGAENVRVRMGRTTVLNAGAYGDVDVAVVGTVRLAGGEYHFRSLDLAPLAGLIADAPSVVHVARELRAGLHAVVRADRAEDLRLEVLGLGGNHHSNPSNDDDHDITRCQSDVRLGPGTQVRALILAPHGAVHVGTFAELNGAVAAASIHVGPYARVAYESGFGQGCSPEACDDGEACNGVETCGAGGCVPGTPPAVDDGNPCTVDTCDPAMGVQHTPETAGTNCDSDGDPCNGTASCDGMGVCIPAPSSCVETDCTNGLDDDGDGQTDCTDTDCADHVTCGGVPPDPATLAPALDTTVPTNLGDAIEFLYAGPTPIQVGLEPGAIDKAHVTLLRGRVVQADGAGLPGIPVHIKNHPEWGMTRTQATGMFDMVVNGGGQHVVVFDADGYGEIQRSATTTWLDTYVMDDVVLTPLDTAVTQVMSDGFSPFQLAMANPVSDSDGPRRAVLAVPAGLTASLRLADGTEVPAPSLSIRLTEVTVGPRGRQAMPGPLPARIGYTYALQVSADEAIAAANARVELSEPVYVYVDDFLQLGAGFHVPLGNWDPVRSAWLGSGDGSSIKILGVDNGVTQIDTDGDDVADDAAALAALGLGGDEQDALGGLYAAGTVIWRVPLPHLSWWDMNFFTVSTTSPASPPVPQAPNAPLPNPYSSDGQDNECGSVIGMQARTLGESIPLVGTPYRLHYDSLRAPGRTAESVLEIPVPRPGLSNVRPQLLSGVNVQIAGRSIRQTFALVPPFDGLTIPYPDDGIWRFVWDGKDAYGRELQGPQRVRLQTFLEYEEAYSLSRGTCCPYALCADSCCSWDFSCPGTQLIASRVVRLAVGEWRDAELRPLGGLNTKELGLGGWTLDENHVYSAAEGELYLGTGQVRSASARPLAMTLVYDENRTVGDSTGSDSVVLEPDGSVVFATLFPDALVRLHPDGNREEYPLPGTAASLARGPDGTIYMVAWDQSGTGVFQWLPTGQLVRLTGSESEGCTIGTGIPALTACLRAQSLAVDGAGDIYVTNGSEIYRIGGKGLLWKIAGGGTVSDYGDEIDALSAQLSARRLAIGTDGSVFFATWNDRIDRLLPQGIIERYAGTGQPGFSGDGGDARSAQINRPGGLAVGSDGLLYFFDSENVRIRAVHPDRTIFTVAGTGAYGAIQQDAPALGTSFNSYSRPLAMGPDGLLYVGEEDGMRLWRIAPALPGFSLADRLVPSPESNEIFRFSYDGRHLETRHGTTGPPLRSFAYTAGGFLSEISDADGRVTQIERDGAGVPTAVVAPDGQRTELVVDASGDLVQATEPGGTVLLGYAAGGLLTRKENARGHATLYAYDDVGRLEREDGPAGNSKVLTQTRVGNQFTVNRASAEGRSQSYVVAGAETGSTRRTRTDGAGGTRVREERPDGTRVVVDPSGREVVEVMGPDGRFGLQRPRVVERRIAMPSGLQSVVQEDVETVASPDNPLVILSETRRVNRNGNVTEVVYDGMTRTTMTTTPVGRVSLTQTDIAGRVTHMESPGVAATDIVYDTAGRPVSIATGDRSTLMTYSAEGWLETVEDPLGRVSRYVRDAPGRVVQQVEPDGRVLQVAYDPNGNVTSITPPGRDPHTFTYTPLDLEETYLPPDVGFTPRVTTNVYDRDGQLTRVVRPDGRTVAHGYDSAGRLSTVDFSRGQLGYEYHPTTGQVAAINAPEDVRLDYSYDGPLVTGTTWSGPVNGSVSFTYDADFRMATRSVNSANTVAYSYDNDGLLTLVGALSIARDAASRRVTGTTLGNVADAFTYNGFGEVAAYSAQYLGTTLFAQSFVRDRLGRITTKTETVESVTTVYGYTYDLAGRLTEVRENGVLVRSYTYDANGNRLSKTTLTETTTADYDGQDRLLRYGNLVYSWTNNGEMASKTDTVTGDTTVSTHDEMGNLVAVVLPDGREITYLIDGQNRRIGKRVNGVLVQGWVYEDQLRVAAELDGAGSVTALMVYSGSPNSPDYVVKGGEAYRTLKDQVGTPRRLVHTTTGAVGQRLDVDEFGVVQADAPIGFQPIGFAGGLYEGDTGLVRFGARDYDARSGTWAAKDRAAFGGGSQNLYSYASGDPVNHTDPSGYVAIPFLYLALAALAEAIEAALVAGMSAIVLLALYAEYAEAVRLLEAAAASEVDEDEAAGERCPPSTPASPGNRMRPQRSNPETCIELGAMLAAVCFAITDEQARQTCFNGVSSFIERCIHGF